MVFGVDWGDAEDFTVVAGYDCGCDQAKILYRGRQTGLKHHEERIVELAEQHKPGLVLAETNLGTRSIEELRARGLPVKPFDTTPSSKPDLIQQLQIAFEHGRIEIADDPVLLDELRAYSMTRTATGRPVYAAASGAHDDCVMALAIALEASRRGAGWEAAEWV